MTGDDEMFELSREERALVSRALRYYAAQCRNGAPDPARHEARYRKRMSEATAAVSLSERLTNTLDDGR